MTEDAADRKAALRTTLIAARRQRGEAERAAAGLAIAEIGADRWNGAPTIAAYLSIRDEPPTRALIDSLADQGATVLLPVIAGNELDWAAYNGPDDLSAGPLGITEPTGQRLGTAALNAAVAILVPALAVDGQGNRLGRGRGYYDRALAAVRAPIVAVVYDEELIAAVPVEPHDRRVDAVLRPYGFTLIS